MGAVSLPAETDLLAAVLGRFGVDDAAISPVGSGGVNRHWRVRTDRRHLALREYRSDRTAGAIAFEHELLNHLYAREWPVAPALPTQEGQTMVTLFDRTYALFPWLDGEPVEAPSLSQLHIRGRLLARLHTDLATFQRREQREGFGRAWELDLFVQPRLHSFNQLLSAFGARFPDLAAGIRREKYRSLRELARLGYGEAPTTVVHGDFGQENLLFRGPRLSGLLDFDFARRDVAAFDLAVALSADCMQPPANDRVDPVRADALLSGYATLRPPTLDDARLIVPLLRAQMLWLAMFWMREWLDGESERHAVSVARLVQLRFPALLMQTQALAALAERLAV